MPTLADRPVPATAGRRERAHRAFGGAGRLRNCVVFVSPLLLVATVVAASEPVASVAPTITVTGHRLSDYAAAVAACVAAHCPPRQDIVASIRYAEAQFKAGDYHGSRATLASAVARNAGAGPAEPLALSQLYLAQATVATRFGEQRDVRQATIDSARIADTYLPVGDPDRLGADLRLADWRLGSQRRERDGNPYVADAAFTRIAAEARAANHPDIAAAADLHHAWALHGRRDDDGAARLLAAVVAMPDAAARPYRLAARVLTARIARQRGDAGAIDVAIAAMRAQPEGHAPVLVYSPPLPQPVDPADRHDGRTLPTDSVTRPGEMNGLQWVDIGFAIRSDGTVDDPEVLRGSRSSGWAKPLLGMIAARRYSPTTGDDATPGHFRLERFTLTADFDTPVGSLIRRRTRTPRFEVLDVTDGAPHRTG